MRRLLLLLGIALLAVACTGQQGVGTAEPPTPTPTGAADMSTPTPDTPTPTSAPAGPKTYAIGDTVTVTEDGEDWAKITISDAEVVESYKSDYDYVEKPRIEGYVFIQAKVTYEALQDGVDYNPFDWQVYCAGEAMDNYTLVLYGPQPDLGSGTLPNGRKASGYVVYEVPREGEVRMSYIGNMFLNDAPIFEVVIRAE